MELDGPFPAVSIGGRDDFSRMPNGARRRSLRAYIARIAYSSIIAISRGVRACLMNPPRFLAYPCTYLQAGRPGRISRTPRYHYNPLVVFGHLTSR